MNDQPKSVVADATHSDFYTNIANQVGIKTVHGRNALRVAVDLACLLDKKQQDYGPHNILAFGKDGVVVRMNDKMERIKKLFKAKGRRKAKNEPLKDSFKDISNYGIIWLLLDADMWPDNESTLE